MTTFSSITNREITLSVPRLRSEWKEFLRSRSLEPVDAPTCVAGLYDSDDRLVATASLVHSSSGFVMQCVAVVEDLEESGLLPRLIQLLQAKAAELSGEARPNLLLYTKPVYTPKFRALTFREVGCSPKAVLMESDRRGIDNYVRYLEAQRLPGVNGVIVMNANPFTLGHRYLIEQAAESVDNLYIIPVLDDTSHGFPYSLRRRAMQAATSDMPNVRILRGSRYAVSAATFPTYFIKSVNERTDTHIALDLDIFIRHIAPALAATVRFVGSEPTDSLTAKYNRAMQTLLPAHGIELRVIERMCCEGEPISASKVRKLLQNKDLRTARSLLTDYTMATLLAEMALRALRRELDTDPKPGLVTPSCSGSHSDMTYKLMSDVIEALRPCFEAFVMQQLTGTYTHEALVHLGLEAEKVMLQTSGGVNTHRGAIFSLGLMVAAAANTESREHSLSSRIAALAAPFCPASGSHGSKVRAKTGLRSALDMAQAGYPELFADWLPYFRSLPKDDPMRLHRLLLRIMSSLDDTNICHRADVEALKQVKADAASLLDNFSPQAYAEFCTDITYRSLSPGGCADMLALTLLADSLIP